ncbi:uncharacterized protein ACRADG_006704 [Cochliomyia hominivorax]
MIQIHFVYLEMEIYVGNIPPNIKQDELRSLYQSFGTIVFIDIKNRCKPPFAFILFDNAGSAYNASISMNGYQYNGYQFQVKLLTCDDDSFSSTNNNNKSEEKGKSLGAQEIPKLTSPPSTAKTLIGPKKSTRKRKVPATPPDGKPGSLKDPLRKGLSGAGIKWYLRYLEQGLEANKARAKAEEHKYIALGCNATTAKRKAEKHCRDLLSSRTLKVIK